MSKALGTYGLTGDALLMGAEAGAILSGMEFSGQYGISHAAATVTKNLIFDWATFSDSEWSDSSKASEDDFELLAQHLPEGPVYAVIDKASPHIQEGLRRGQPNIFLPLDRQGIDPFRQRFPVTLRYEGTVRGVGGLMIDAAGATSVPGLFAAGDAASREPVVGATSGGGGPNSTWAIASGFIGRALGCGARRRRLRAARLIKGGRRQRTREIANPGPRSTRDRLPTTFRARRRRCFRWNATSRGTQGVCRTRLPTSPTRVGLFALRGARSCPDRRGRRREREVAAMLATARWICASALERRETRGIHRRRDFPILIDAPPRSLRLRGVHEHKVL